MEGVLYQPLHEGVNQFTTLLQRAIRKMQQPHPTLITNSNSWFKNAYEITQSFPSGGEQSMIFFGIQFFWAYSKCLFDYY